MLKRLLTACQLSAALFKAFMVPPVPRSLRETVRAARVPYAIMSFRLTVTQEAS